MRARRQVLATGLVLGYLAAGGVTLALGDRVAGGTWLALHLVLLGGLTNAIVAWSEHFAAALLRVPRAGERAATVRALALNLGVLAVLVGVHAGPLPAVRRSLAPLAGGLAVTTVGLLARLRPLALAGLAGYLAGLLVALQPFTRTLLRRRPHTAASWMLGAGIAWFALAVAADLVALAGSRRVVDLDGRVGRLVPAVVVGFGLQVLTGALTYLLPVVWGRGAFGNRRLTAVLEAGWRPRVAAANLGCCCWWPRPPGVGPAGPAGGWPRWASAPSCRWRRRRWPGRVVEDTRPGGPAR